MPFGFIIFLFKVKRNIVSNSDYISQAIICLVGKCLSVHLHYLAVVAINE